MSRTACHKFSPADCAAQLPTDRYFIALNRGTLEVGLYAPEGTDPQHPHDQDECYVILEGEGRFTMGDETALFQPGDFFFVPAGVPHQFLDFNDSFKAWVMFYGPKGGEDPMQVPPGRSSSPSS
ncbi:MAG: cupin domain-containing protein [Acidobacteria bacterium]|nr:cupin domain-containing protein [Gemmatimonadota bacterium]MYF14795.1 cupin domain-containing protein [Acidobacteriota bacterium]MYJ69053.1 cupin domain-containing protein [Gemmatimonadota bacterium]